MPESWDDLVTPVGRTVVNAMVDYLPGYATERENFLRRTNEGLGRQDAAQLAERLLMAAPGRAPMRGSQPRVMPTAGDLADTPGVMRTNAMATPASRPATAANENARLAPLPDETVSSAALRVGDQVFMGRTHLEAAGDASRKLGLPETATWELLSRGGNDGFVTSTGRYVSREEAATLAGARGRFSSEDMATTKGGDAPVPVTADRAVALIENLGGRVTQRKTVKGTTYIKYEGPNGPGLPFQAQPTIRIPSDGHAGRPPTPGEAGVYFDAASRPGTRTRLDPLTATDDAGRPYADFRVLEDTLRRRFGQTPEPASRPRGPDNSPNQPRLLAAGAPAAAGWAATVHPERPEMAARDSEPQSNAGRFSAPLVSPDAQLAADTRSMSDRVSVATRNIEADFDWSDLVIPVTPHAMAGMRRAYNAMAAQ